jgi:hypothetical protein
VEGSCEHGNELLGSVKHFGSSLVTEQLAASQEELSSMELVSGFKFGYVKRKNMIVRLLGNEQITSLLKITIVLTHFKSTHVCKARDRNYG